jgi:hypothetical protein
MKRIMKPIVLAAILVASGGLSAVADTTIYRNILKTPRDDYALHADGQYCDWVVGPDRNGVPTSRSYKRCMLGRGWRYRYTKWEPAPKTWIDPDTGLTCHDILGGFGSVCSNF